MKVGIIDFRAGNLQSVRNALYDAGADPVIVTEPEDILGFDRLIVPGVGAAGTALERLRRQGLDQALTEAVRKKARPMLGICLGMQVMASKLYEFGEHPGLRWIEGEVVHLSLVAGAARRVPHMGWNQVHFRNGGDPSLGRVVHEREFYFCHSYTLRVRCPRTVVATTEYGAPLVAAVQDQTVFATQFHPEKSQLAGRRFLKAFLDWKP